MHTEMITIKPSQQRLFEMITDYRPGSFSTSWANYSICTTEHEEILLNLFLETLGSPNFPDHFIEVLIAQIGNLKSIMNPGDDWECRAKMFISDVAYTTLECYLRDE